MSTKGYTKVKGMKAKRRGVSVDPGAIQRVKYAGSVQNLRVAQNRAAIRAVTGRLGAGRDNLTFDAVVLGTNLLSPASNSAVAVSATGYITNQASAHVLNQVPQGTTSTTRLGRKMYMRKVRIQGTVSQAAASTLNTVRMALVYIPRLDRGTTTMPPQNVIWTSQDPRENRVLNNSDRFKVLRQWVHVLMGNSTTPATGTELIHFDEMVDVNRHTTWTQADTTGVFDNMEEGGLCLYVHGPNTVASGLAPVISYTSRLYFEDR